MSDQILNALTCPITLQFKTDTDDGMGGQKEDNISQGCKTWAKIKPVPAKNWSQFLPKGPKSANFSNPSWGEVYEITIRNQKNLNDIYQIVWQGKILKAVTPPHQYQLPGYTTFHAAKWSLKE